MANTTLVPMDVSGRLDRLRSSFDEHGCDALLITNLTNIRYLTGFTGSAALLLLTPDNALVTSDGRYAIQSSQQIEAEGVNAEITIGGFDKQKEALVALAGSATRLGLEASNVTWAQQRAFADEWFSTKELIPTSKAVENLRLVKDQGEVARIAAACRIADEALSNVKPILMDLPTEADFAFALDFEIRKLGAEDISFDTIVAAGANGAKAHHEPTGKRIAPGELVVIDYGALVDGYHSDTTRTVCVGEPGTAELQRMFDVVKESQAAGVERVRAGATAAEVDAECRRVIDEAGWGDAFTHSTGHGVGLDIHEAPAVAGSVTDHLVPNQVITVEPGVYLSSIGGVRIEDTVVVSETDCSTLTNITKELVVS